jgi:hemerythrin
MMQEKKFPAYAVHKQEHDNVLNAMKNIHEDLRKTKSAAGVKNFVQNGLVRWLITHIQTMDTVTARFLEGKISLNHPIN